MRVHIVSDGVVINTIEADDLNFPVGEGQVVIDGDVGGIGWAWDGEKLVAPMAPEPFPVQMRSVFSVREFRQRFTLDEQMAIRAASGTDMQVGLVYDEFLSAQFIDIEDPAVATGIDLYISKDLLEASRRQELLAREPFDAA
ncbi:hypothetical protein RAS12_11840 [Achromobacter seleniivolatilans]|uniref:Uncharacterized protein n=1 Tax=Achromobacter seleniivolatilans TaxID=3047478 RepID=A0ABY9M8T4_9BURK|nr:hypothetical protein [Achromobacter sp. R39]WMD23028.1 hypothetical protein RAS12_11840 [Achromobacter sp. R39]